MFSFPSGFKCHCSWVLSYHLYVSGSVSRILILPEVSGLTLWVSCENWGFEELLFSMNILNVGTRDPDRSLPKHFRLSLSLSTMCKLPLWSCRYDYVIWGEKVKGTEPLLYPLPISLSLFSSIFIGIIEIFTMA